MNIGIDIDNTITEVQEQLDEAIYHYAIRAWKKRKEKHKANKRHKKQIWAYT